jgi:hypothetical protein
MMACRGVVGLTVDMNMRRGRASGLLELHWISARIVLEAE